MWRMDIYQEQEERTTRLKDASQRHMKGTGLRAGEEMNRAKISHTGNPRWRREINQQESHRKFRDVWDSSVQRKGPEVHESSGLSESCLDSSLMTTTTEHREDSSPCSCCLLPRASRNWHRWRHPGDTTTKTVTVNEKAGSSTLPVVAMFSGVFYLLLIQHKVIKT